MTGQDDQASYFIVLRYRYPLTPDVAPGSVVIMANCGHRAYISPEGIQVVEETSAYLVCHECIDPLDQIKDKRVPETILESVQRWKGPVEADQVRAWARDAGFRRV